MATTAATLMEDGDTVLVDLSTAVLEVVQCLVGKRNLTIIANSTLAVQAAAG